MRAIFSAMGRSCRLESVLTFPARALCATR